MDIDEKQQARWDAIEALIGGDKRPSAENLRKARRLIAKLPKSDIETRQIWSAVLYSWVNIRGKTS